MSSVDYPSYHDHNSNDKEVIIMSACVAFGIALAISLIFAVVHKQHVYNQQTQHCQAYLHKPLAQAPGDCLQYFNHLQQ